MVLALMIDIGHDLSQAPLSKCDDTVLILPKEFGIGVKDMIHKIGTLPFDFSHES